MQKTSQFIILCKGDIKHAFETVKVIVFDPVMCRSPDVPLQLKLQVLKVGWFSVAGSSFSK